MTFLQMRVVHFQINFKTLYAEIPKPDRQKSSEITTNQSLRVISYRQNTQVSSLGQPFKPPSKQGGKIHGDTDKITNSVFHSP